MCHRKAGLHIAIPKRKRERERERGMLHRAKATIRDYPKGKQLPCPVLLGHIAMPKNAQLTLIISLSPLHRGSLSPVAHSQRCHSAEIPIQSCFLCATNTVTALWSIPASEARDRAKDAFLTVSHECLLSTLSGSCPLPSQSHLLSQYTTAPPITFFKIKTSPWLLHSKSHTSCF